MTHPWTRSFAAIVATVMIAPIIGPASAQDKASLTVQLATGPVSIAQSIPEDLGERVSELVKNRLALTTVADARIPLIVIYEAIDAGVVSNLRALGIRPGPRLSDNSMIVFADAGGVEALRSSAGLLGADIFPATAKVTAEARRAVPLPWEKRAGNARAYSLLVFEGTTSKEIEALRDLGIIRAFENYDPTVFDIVRVVTVVLSPSDVSRLATQPIVARIEPVSPPDIPDNFLNTQPMSNVDAVQINPYNLSGANEGVGVWEATETATNGFGVRDTHQDLNGRVTVEETSNFSNHATHVAGTIASSGVNTANAEGMAPAVALSSYGSAGDANEMTLAKNSAGGSGDPMPISVSNHSYGIGTGWNGAGTQISSSQVNFGQYTNNSVAFDNVVIGTDLVVVKSAGNDRNDVWDNASTDPSIPNPRPPRDCTQNGLAVDADCLGPRSVAKNIITVGAMTSGGGIAVFSSFGPTDDGRIKPDIMANGTNVLSLGAASDSNTWANQGTSMAAPAVSGMVALLFEEASNQGVTLSAAGAKSLLIQSAQDVNGVGQATAGPDYATGWGIADIQGAVDLLQLAGGPGLAQETLSLAGAAGGYTQAFLVPAGLPELHVSLVWTDPAGNPLAAQNLPKLVNDLDLRLISPTGVTFAPWTLNPAIPGNQALRNGGDDTLNNVEQVSVLTPNSGVWQVQVTAKATAFTSPQDFAIAGPLSPASGPFVSDPADIMLVLDKSGSMNLPAATPGISKIGALKSAAEEVANFLEIVGGHQLGLVEFASTASSTTPTFDLQALDSTTISGAETAIQGISAGGGTNIIDGVEDAVAQLAGPLAANLRQVIMLFSDGRHNTPSGSDVADIDAAMANNTLFYSIGFGTDVDSSVMPGVAANHGGVHLEEQSLTAAELSKLFITLAGVAIDETIVVDPDYVVQPGGFAEQSVIADPGDQSLTFATHWNTPNSDQFRFVLRGPNKECRIPMKDHAGLQTRHGGRYHLVRIDLPYKCAYSDEYLHEGRWTLGLRSVGVNTDTAKVVVLSKSALKLNARTSVNAGSMSIVAWLDRKGETVLDAANIVACLGRNLPSSGDSEKQDHTKPAAGSSLVLGNRFVLDRPAENLSALQLRPEIARTVDRDRLARISVLRPAKPSNAYAPKEQICLELRDDGLGGDKQAFDGRYSGNLNLKSAGLYQIRVMLNLPSNFGPVRRELLTSALVK